MAQVIFTRVIIHGCMTVNLKISKALFALIIAIVNGVLVYLGTILPFYLPENIAAPTVILVDVIGNALIVYLTTQEESVPVVQPPAN